MNYYDVFGVPPTASSEDISAAHKSLAKMYHPDINSSDDANERMAILNEANEVLSDTVKREEYDRRMGISRSQKREREFLSHRDVNARWPREMKYPEERTEKAAVMRKKAEARLRTVEEARARRLEQEQQKAAEEARRRKQMRADHNRQQVINELSSVVMGATAQQNKKKDVDEDLRNATKVLLSLVRNDNEHLQRMAEEADRKKRIEEILSLVKEYNDEANPDRLV